MTGVQLFTYTQRRLAESGSAFTVDSDRSAELYDYITEGRDWILESMALAAPVTVRQLVTLEVDVTNSSLYNFPTATKDPFRCIEIRDVSTRKPMRPAQTLDFDGGEYVWVSLRQVRLAEFVSPTGGLEGYFILHNGDITSATTEANIGAPTTMHRAIGKAAALLALTQNEASDGRAALAVLMAELDKLERIYGEYDMQGGLSLREALMQSTGDVYGDTLN